MNSFDKNTHSFIVRIWLEPRELEEKASKWRGMVEHVASGNRRYVADLNDIIPFIASYRFSQIQKE